MANYIKTLEARVEELESRLQEKAELVAASTSSRPSSRASTRTAAARTGSPPATCSAGSPSWNGSEHQPPGRPGGNFLLTSACLLPWLLMLAICS